MPSTVFSQSCWCILIYLFLLSQIGMYQTAYDLLGIFHNDAKKIPDFSLRGHSLVVVSLATYFQVYHSTAFI